MPEPTRVMSALLPRDRRPKHFPQGGQPFEGSRVAGRVGRLGAFGMGAGSFHGKEEK